MLITPGDWRLSSLPRELACRQSIDVHRGLLGRHSEVALADDGAAVEHAARHMPGHRHGDSLGDACTHHVTGGSAAQIT